jgi:hypothetical protein
MKDREYVDESEAIRGSPNKSRVRWPMSWFARNRAAARPEPLTGTTGDLFHVYIVDSGSGSGSIMHERDGIWPNARTAIETVLREWDCDGKTRVPTSTGDPEHNMAVYCHRQSLTLGKYINATGIATLSWDFKSGEDYALVLSGHPTIYTFRTHSVAEMWHALNTFKLVPLR